MSRVVCLMLVSTSVALSQPLRTGTSVCTGVEHCPSNYYCDEALGLCQKCVQCELLGRGAPNTTDPCVYSVTDCGFCLEGYKLNTTLNTCVPLEYEPFQYWWVIFGCSLGLAIGISAITLHLLRNLKTIKILACNTTRTVDSPSSDVEEAIIPAPPPPYNAAVMLPTLQQVDELAPFIKPIQEQCTETETRQTACVMNEPEYIRDSEPPSYGDTTEEGEFATIQEDASEINAVQNQENFTSNAVHADNPASKNLQIAKFSGIKMDLNYNRRDNEEYERSSQHPYGHSTTGAGAAVINVNMNLNLHAMNQNNDVNL